MKINAFEHNDIVVNAKGDLNSSLNGEIVTVQGTSVGLGGTVSLTIDSSGSIIATNGTLSGQSFWVETGSGWQGASFYNVSWGNPQNLQGISTQTPSSSGSGTPSRIFSVTVDSSTQVAQVQWSVTITNTGANPNYSISFTVRVIADPNAPS